MGCGGRSEKDGEIKEDFLEEAGLKSKKELGEEIYEAKA